MKNLYVDFDGVLVDTITTSYQMLDENKIDKANVKEVKKFYQNLDWKEVIEISPIINDNINGLKKIIASKKFNVAILTHVISLEEAVAKVEFLRSHDCDVMIIPCPKSLNKCELVNAKDAILIDDYSGNLRLWEKEGGIGVRFSTELDAKGFLCIDKIDDILNMDL